MHWVVLGCTISVSVCSSLYRVADVYLPVWPICFGLNENVYPQGWGGLDKRQFFFSSYLNCCGRTGVRRHWIVHNALICS